MSDENTRPRSHCNGYITSQLLPLRDRLTKIETLMEYHDREFGEIKHSMKDLADKVMNTHADINKKLDINHQNTLDVIYDHVRNEDVKFDKLLLASTDNRLAISKILSRVAAGAATIIAAIGIIIWAIDVGVISFNIVSPEAHIKLHSIISQDSPTASATPRLKP